jgi:polyhydroxybutyrate depolymerase
MSGGCGMPAPFAGAMEQTLEIEGVERSYILVVPDGYDPAQAYPLVFAWHGRGGDASTSRLYFKVEEAAQGAAIFVYPNGLPLAEMENQTGWDLDPANEDFAFFDAMLAEMSATLCVDEAGVQHRAQLRRVHVEPARVLPRGRGAGDRVRSPAVGRSGAGASGQVAAWLAHGTMDMVVPFSRARCSRDHWSAGQRLRGRGRGGRPGALHDVHGLRRRLPGDLVRARDPRLPRAHVAELGRAGDLEVLRPVLRWRAAPVPGQAPS